jgi:Type III restriction enzyme, res subunit
MSAVPPDGFFERPILNSPYDYPARHWELDADGQPTGQIAEKRREARFITPIPRPRKRKRAKGQTGFVFDEGAGVSTAAQQYDPTPIINELRRHVDKWRAIANPIYWGVTPETARLLQHWRHHEFSGIRPFFCQVEAVETVIWLTEVAPNERAWHTINAVRRPQSRRFTRGFLVVTPGITIKDRLRVLLPNDPDSYYASRELVPGDMLDDVNRAKIVITNYHAFKRHERVELSKGGRALLQGRVGGELETLESEGQLLQRVMPELMGLKSVLVLNDEAHHCYREKPDQDDEEDLKGDDRKEAERNNEAARLWISGLEVVNRKLGLARVIDLSATPFFLRGSGYAEGTLFPWTMSDFSLMDAIEAGIVKLPRVPVAENIPGDDMPMFRNGPERAAARPAASTPSRCPPDCRQRSRPSTATTTRRLPCGSRRRSQCPRVSSWSATTPRRPSWSTITSRASAGPTRTAPRASSRAAWCSSATSTSTATRCRVPGRCSSTASSSRAETRSTMTSATWRRTRCRVAESHPRVRAYAKNHNLGLEVPYRYGSETRRYLPDFIVLVDDGHGESDLLHLVVEIKGYRREDAKEKKATMDTYWVRAGRAPAEISA